MALILWGFVNVGVVLLIAWTMNPLTTTLRQVLGVSVVLWLFAFYPILCTLGQGQDSLILLLLTALSLRFAARKQLFSSGLVLGLALFKFHLVFGVAFFTFVLPRKWRGVIGFVISSILVTGISRAAVGQGFPVAYIGMLRHQEEITPWGFIPWFMPNLRGLLTWILPWDVGVCLLITMFGSAVVATVAIWVVIRSHSNLSETELFTLAILTVLLVSFHLHMQDLTLAALPILVLLDAALRSQLTSNRAVILTFSIVALYSYRITAEAIPILLLRGAVLAIPLILLWMVAIGISDIRIPRFEIRTLKINQP